MSVTITACANSTPPAGTVIATCSIGGENYQLFILTDAAGNTIGVSGSPLSASITNSPSVVVNSGSIVVTNQISASITAGSVALLAGANTIGAASAIQSGAWGVSASVVNSPSVVVSSGSVVVTNGLSASISNAVTVVQGASGASPWGVRILDAAGLAYGVAAGSPLHVAASAIITNSPSVFVTSAVASPIFTRLSDGTDTVAVDAASRLLVTASFADGLTVTSASVTVVNNATASPLFTRLTDGTDTVAVDAASRLLVTASFSDNLAVTAASVTVVNNSAASVIYTSACITNLAGSAAGSPLFASITNSPSVFVTSAIASPVFVRLSDGTDSVAVDAASRLLVTASFTDGLSVTAASVTIVNNSAGACVLFTSACVTNMAGSAAGSPLFTSVTNQVSASISNTLTVIPGASGASPWAVKITDGNANAFGYGAASPLFTSVVSMAGSAAGSPLFVSACITNSAGSAAGSPLFASITNLSGSAAGSPLFVSACITNLAGSANGSPLFVRQTDGVDTGAIDSASRQLVAISDGTNAYGLPASPLSQVGQGQTMAWAGSLLTIQQVNLSSSISGCTPIVASTAGFATVILNATFTTSSCQLIGWAACGNNGGASATIQTRMPFGTNGGMDAKRSPDSYLWAFPSGSIAVLTTTSACVVAGTINYISVAS